MVKLLVILIAVLVCFILYKNKTEKVNNEKGKYNSNSLYYLHIISGVVITFIATIHAIGKFKVAQLGMILTGGIALLLLYIQIINGLFLRKNYNSGLKRVHKIIPIIIVFCIVGHVFVAKMI